MSFSKSLENLQKPQWFIRSEGNKFKTNDSVLSSLRDLESRLVVVSIAGSLRTGKSWILGQLAGCAAGDGFDVADGQTAVTNGIWILCRKHPQKKNCVVVFLDTEGLHNPYKKDTTNDDNRLFILTFLLSDIFIFNAMQKFDNIDLENIGFITMISKKLQMTDTQKSFPELILLLRDVEQVKVRDRTMHPNDYLEDVLQHSDDEYDRSTPKWCIRNYCKKRACYSLTQPVEFGDIANLGQMEQPVLRSRFKDDFKKLKDHLLKDSDIKRFTDDLPYKTSEFCSFANELTSTVNKHEIPKMRPFLKRIAEEENKRVWDVITEAFAAGMRDEEKNSLNESLSKKFIALQRDGIEKLEHDLIQMSDGHKIEKRQEFKEYAHEEYLKVSAEKSRAVLVDLLQPLIDDTSYKAPNAKETFKTDVQKAKAKYDKMNDLGPEKEKIWKERKKDIKQKTQHLQAVDRIHELQLNEERSRQMAQAETTGMKSANNRFYSHAFAYVAGAFALSKLFIHFLVHSIIDKITGR